ncbi:transglutaminaseTgpA domain-containing protein [Candidatus Soleaferrea massiliensis]|uniref:transglutaminase family protein n=1 Tax=Candidatus Soleaferrea massiliensis TaxID=1470354 RepID=UPI0005905D7D|nr:transglutaminase domain-containing protein [Candidatus Soleaferrea massiliensis]
MTDTVYRPWLRFAGGALILMTGVYGILICLINSFSFLEPSAKDLLQFAPFMVLLFAGIFALPKYRGYAVLGSLVIWDGLAFLFREPLYYGAIHAAEGVSTELSRVSPWFRSYTSAHPMLGQEGCPIFLLFALFLIVALLAWAVLKAKSILLTLLPTLPVLGVSIALNGVPGMLETVLILGFWITVLMLGRAGRRSSEGTAKIGMLALPASLLFVLIMALLLPSDSYSPNAQVMNLRNRLTGAGTNGWQMNSPGFVDLAGQSEWNPTGKPVLRVKTDGPNRIYLRGGSGEVYTGTSWEPLPETIYEQLDLDFQPLLYAELSLDAYRDQTLDKSSITVRNVGADQLVAYTPYNMYAADGFEKGFYKDSALRNSIGASEYTLRFVPRASYAEGNPIPLDEDTDRYLEFVKEHYTQLPENLKKRLKEYIWSKFQMVENDNPYMWLSMAQAIVAKIHSDGTYTRTPGPTPEGRDFVDYFLFESHQGYCVHFASAATAVLRAAGIPARFVQGYTVHRDNFGDDGWAEITDEQAHAWTEIWLPQIGWYPLDPTPGGIYGGRGESGNESAASHEQSAVSSEDSDVSSQPSSSIDSRGPVPREDASWLLWLVFIVLFAAIAVVLTHLISRILRTRRFAQPDTDRAALAVYTYLEHLERFGYRVSEQAMRLANKAKFSQYQLTEEERQALVKEAEAASESTGAHIGAWWKKAWFWLLYR